MGLFKRRARSGPASEPFEQHYIPPATTVEPGRNSRNLRARRVINPGTPEQSHAYAEVSPPHRAEFHGPDQVAQAMAEQARVPMSRITQGTNTQGAQFLAVNRPPVMERIHSDTPGHGLAFARDVAHQAHAMWGEHPTASSLTSGGFRVAQRLSAEGAFSGDTGSIPRVGSMEMRSSKINLQQWDDTDPTMRPLPQRDASSSGPASLVRRGQGR